MVTLTVKGADLPRLVDIDVNKWLLAKSKKFCLVIRVRKCLHAHFVEFICLLCCHYWCLVFLHQVCALLAVSTVAGWSSKGISYRDLNRSDFNVRSNINFFIAVAVICIIFLSINVFIVLLNKRPIPPKIVSYSPYLSNSVSLYVSVCEILCVYCLFVFGGVV